MKPDEAALWQQCRQGDEQARGALIERYLPLVRLTRERQVPLVPPVIDAGDLEAVGMGALIRAVDRFDPARGVAFPSFAITLIRGAMLEWLRTEDWAPRSERAKERRGEPALLWEVVSLDALMYGDDGAERDLMLLDTLVDPTPGPEEQVLAQTEVAEQQEWVARARALLPDAWWHTLWSTYGEGRRLKAVAQELARSESRAYQYNQAALIRLRQAFGVPAEWPLPVLRAIRASAYAKAPGSHCRNGHPRTPENTLAGGRGSYRCRLCKREAARRQYRRQQYRRQQERA